jgi:hypothetical protein
MPGVPSRYRRVWQHAESHIHHCKAVRLPAAGCYPASHRRQACMKTTMHLLLHSFIYSFSINPVGSTISCGCGNRPGYIYSRKVQLVMNRTAETGVCVCNRPNGPVLSECPIVVVYHVQQVININSANWNYTILNFILSRLVSDFKGEHRLKVFENRVLRKIFWPKRDGIGRGWRKLCNEELHSLYSLPSIIRVIKSREMRWAGHVARVGRKRNAYRMLVGKPEGKRPLGRPKRRWDNSIRIDLRGIGWGGMDWIDLAEDRDHGNEPTGPIKCREILE